MKELLGGIAGIMAPTDPLIASQMRQLIYYHLDNDFLENAVFIAGRLHAYEPRSYEASYLLARCHLRLGQLQLAYDYSRPSGSRGGHLGCAFAFAQACLGLKRYKEGIAALDLCKRLWVRRSTWSEW